MFSGTLERLGNKVKTVDELSVVCLQRYSGVRRSGWIQCVEMRWYDGDCHNAINPAHRSLMDATLTKRSSWTDWTTVVNEQNGS
jgi:hypothetical protein